jgi:hypothetical protein
MTPDGNPDADIVTLSLKPFWATTEMVLAALPP